MADDLRERIRRGELAAFADPALALHLLAEPDAAWWWEGAHRVLLAMLHTPIGAAAMFGLHDHDALIVRYLLVEVRGRTYEQRSAEQHAALAVIERYAG